MSGTKQPSGKDKAKKQPANRKPTSKQYDEAFDDLAAFLFDQYRKHKESTELPDLDSA